MDAAALLTSARNAAHLSKTRLAQLSGTSPAAICAYESGRRSPTVATLNRLLAACRLQVRGELEPLLAHVDEVVDRLLTGEPAPLSWTTASLVRAFAASEVVFALDGQSALAAHGLAADVSGVPEIVAQDGEDLRSLLNDVWARPQDRDGMPIYTDWHDLDRVRLGPGPMYTRVGFVRLRIVTQLPTPIAIELQLDPEDEPEVPSITCPVLGLMDVEQAHPALADVLARLRERRTVSS